MGTGTGNKSGTGRKKTGTGTRSGTGTGTGASETKEKKKGAGRPFGATTRKKRQNALAISQLKDAARTHQLDESSEESDYNARQVEHVLKIAEIASHADRKDVASLRSCFVNYLRLCQMDGFKVGNLAAYAAMGIDSNVAKAWDRGRDEEHKELIRYVRQVCGLFREGLIADQKINPVIGIFWQRNFDGLRNDTEQQAITQEMDRQSELVSGDDYKRKYGALLDE